MKNIKKVLLHSLKIALVLSLACMIGISQAAENQVAENQAVATERVDNTERVDAGVQESNSVLHTIKNRAMTAIVTISNTADAVCQVAENGWKRYEKNAKKISIASLAATAGLMCYTYGKSGSKLVVLFREIGNCNLFVLSGALASGYFGCKILGGCARDFAKNNKVMTAILAAGAVGTARVSQISDATVLGISEQLSKAMFGVTGGLIHKVNPQLLTALGDFKDTTVSDVTLPLWVCYSGWKSLKYVLQKDVSGVVVADENAGGALRVQGIENESGVYASLWSLVALASAIRAATA